MEKIGVYQTSETRILSLAGRWLGVFPSRSSIRNWTEWWYSARVGRVHRWGMKDRMILEVERGKSGFVRGLGFICICFFSLTNKWTEIEFPVWVLCRTNSRAEKLYKHDITTPGHSEGSRQERRISCDSPTCLFTHSHSIWITHCQSQISSEKTLSSQNTTIGAIDRSASTRRGTKLIKLKATRVGYSSHMECVDGFVSRPDYSSKIRKVLAWLIIHPDTKICSPRWP